MAEMIYAESGQSAAPAILEMKTHHLQSLTDGQFFLEHLHALRAVAIEPYCRHCLHLGLAPQVEISIAPDTFEFRCQHRSGWVKRDAFLELQPLLTALGWDLRCTKCLQLIEAANDRTDPVFLVSCPCAIRRMANPIAASLPTSG